MLTATTPQQTPRGAGSATPGGIDPGNLASLLQALAASGNPQSMSMVDVLSLPQALNLTGVKQQPSSSTTATLVGPRVGGVDENGAWTGLGKNNLGSKPKSGLCHRKFSDRSKAISKINEIERECKKGTSEQSNCLFTLPLEQASKTLSDCLSAFGTFAINCGLEGSSIVHT